MPIKAAVLPLVNRDGMDEIGRRMYRELQKEFNVFYDDSGSVGRRYRRQDEVGTPWCVTYDFDSETDSAVTIRDRDSLAQDRVQLGKVADEIHARLKSS